MTTIFPYNFNRNFWKNAFLCTSLCLLKQKKYIAGYFQEFKLQNTIHCIQQLKKFYPCKFLQLKGNARCHCIRRVRHNINIVFYYYSSSKGEKTLRTANHYLERSIFTLDSPFKQSSLFHIYINALFLV